nr:hypothetical protein StreXyl84_76600 [Streptomyces sp. Xyl84]
MKSGNGEAAARGGAEAACMSSPASAHGSEVISSAPAIIEHRNEHPSRLQLLRYAVHMVVQQAPGALAPDRRLDRGGRATRGRTAPGRGDAAAIARVRVRYGLDRTNADAVHTSECWAAAESSRCRPVTRQQAVEASRRLVPACAHGRPDTAPGILDQCRIRHPSPRRGAGVDLCDTFGAAVHHRESKEVRPINAVTGRGSLLRMAWERPHKASRKA